MWLYWWASRVGCAIYAPGLLDFFIPFFYNYKTLIKECSIIIAIRWIDYFYTYTAIAKFKIQNFESREECLILERDEEQPCDWRRVGLCRSLYYERGCCVCVYTHFAAAFTMGDSVFLREDMRANKPLEDRFFFWKIRASALPFRLHSAFLTSKLLIGLRIWYRWEREISVDEFCIYWGEPECSLV